MKRTIALAGLCVVVSHTLSRQAYPVLLNAVRDDLLDGSNKLAGLLVTAIFAAYMAGVAIMTVVSGRVEPRQSLMVGLWLSGGGFLLLYIATNVAALAVGLALAGLGSAGVWMSVPAIATGAVRPDRRGMVMGFMSSSIGMGLVVFGQAVRLIRHAGDDDAIWRPLWLWSAVFTFLVLGMVAAFLRPQPTARATTSLNLAVLRQVNGWVPLTAAYLLFGLQVSAFAPFLGATYARHGFSEGHIATLYSLIGLSAIVGATTLGRLSDAIGRKPVLMMAMATMGMSSALVTLGREPFASLAAVLNGATSYAFPVLVTITLRDYVSDRAFSNALGVITLIYGTSLVVGPITAGAIGDSTLGFDALYGILATLAALSTACLLFLPSSRRVTQHAT